MSPVPVKLPLLGTMLFRAQVKPELSETYTGAVPLPVPLGFGVKAVPTIRWGKAGLTARNGSLSWFVSPLRLAGIMFTTLTAEDSENATGKVVQPDAPLSATSALPSALKSPTNGWALALAAQAAKLTIDRLVTLKLPFPFEKATGSVVPPEPTVRAPSAKPSPLKSPTSALTLAV